MVSRVNNVVKYVDEQLIKLELDKRVNVIHLYVNRQSNY